MTAEHDGRHHHPDEICLLCVEEVLLDILILEND